ncbi:MAG: hypothetical protein IT480_08305 [Gammaproteobacteria bacterium]|nr:hypothetical protein [Gammaproteobacteria bacterium]
MRVLTLAGLLLMAPPADAARAGGFPGTYRSDAMTVEINEGKPGQFFGVLRVDDEVYEHARGGAYQRATAGGYIGGDGHTRYVFDPKSGSGVMVDN